MKKIISIFVLTCFIGSHSYAGNENITNAAAGAVSGSLIIMTSVNTAQGENFLQKCSSAWPYCAMAALAFAQAAMALKGAKDAKETQAASDCYGPYCGGGNGGNLNPTGGTTDPGLGTLPEGNTDDTLGRIQDDINKKLGDLGNKGYSYDPATNSVNTPKGNVSASSLGSSEGLKGLGMTDEQISDVQKIAADALKDAQKYADGDFGGGGGRKIKPGPGYDGDQNFDMNKYLAGLMKKKGDARGIAGLEKTYGSDQIGIAQDDIFKMVHRRYQAKKPSLTP